MRRTLSLLKPTGHLTLGNLLGALLPMARAQDDSDCFLRHCRPARAGTVTTRDGCANDVREIATTMLAVGLDRSTLFRQGRVPAHAELAYLLEWTATSESSAGWSSSWRRVTRPDSTRASLFTYPALMAADILLYRPEQVPVGDDQRQHVELTRDLALRFNVATGRCYDPEVVTPRSALG